MRKRDIFKTIKQEIEHETPDIRHRIDISSVFIYRPLPKRSIKPHFQYAIKTVSLTVLLLSALLTMSLKHPLHQTQPASSFSSEKSIVAFALASGSQLVNNGVLTIRGIPLNHWMDSSETSLVEQELLSLNPHLNMIELLVGDNRNMRITEHQVVFDDYHHQLTFHTRNWLGESLAYPIHYKRFNSNPGEHTLQGIVRLKDKDIFFLGYQHVFEGVHDFSVNIFESSDSRNNYIKVSYTKDQHHIIFSYHMYVHNILIGESYLTVKQDRNTMIADYYLKTDRGISEIVAHVPQHQSRMEIDYAIRNRRGIYEEGMIHVSIERDIVANSTYYRYEAIDSSGFTLFDMTQVRQTHGVTD